jgi:hypothetical protein
MTQTFTGDFKDHKLTPNPEEVESLFTIPLGDLLDRDNWEMNDFSTPIFTGNV